MDYNQSVFLAFAGQIDTGESTRGLGRPAAVAGAVELGLKKKAAILPRRCTRSMRLDRWFSLQIHVAITSGGLDLTPAY
jgi:hypothetical protein